MGTRNVLGDRILVTSQTIGTGAYALGNAVSDGFFSPAEASPSLNGLRVGYTALDSLTAPLTVEVGEGVLATGTPWTLTRATIRRSKVGGVAGSSAVNWAVGTRFIFITPLSANTLTLDTDGWIHPAADLVLATAGAERLRISAAGPVSIAAPVLIAAGQSLSMGGTQTPIFLYNNSANNQAYITTDAGGAVVIGNGNGTVAPRLTIGANGVASFSGPVVIAAGQNLTMGGTQTPIWLYNFGATNQAYITTNVGGSVIIGNGNGTVAERVVIDSATGVANFSARPTHAGVPLATIPTRIGTSVGGAAVLPAGGTWEWWLFRVNNSTGAVTSASNSGGPTAGGTTIGAATAGEVWSGLAWRVT